MQEQQKRFTASDGAELFYRYRPAASGQTDRAIVLFHRGHEHSGRMIFLADELQLDDFAFFAWDARGHGHSPGERGDSPSLARSVQDVQEFMAHIQATYGLAQEQLAVVAQSVGAVLVATWLHDYAPKIRCAVLASPAFKVKLYVPWARPGLRLLHKLRGNFFVNSYVKARYLTHDPERIASYDSDSLIARAISVRILLGLYDAADRVVADAAAIGTPVQLLVSGSDWVVHHAPQHAFFNRLGSLVKERQVLPGFYHDTLGEQKRELALQHIRRFVRERFESPLELPDMRQAHRQGVSRREADELATPLSPLTPRGAWWALQRWVIRLGRHGSEGIRLGVQTGFDSGSTLDYVYRNEARGSHALGRLMDRNYLDAIGWRGIRQRKVHLGQAIQGAMQALRAAGKPVHVLDIAAGHGRYVLDALTDAQQPDSIRLRDYSDLNVQAGRTLIAERGLQAIASFEAADAYEPANYRQLQPRPTLGIVSGLHELFPDNDLVMRSLQGLGEAIEAGGYLIYTGQPWHPQLEMIARCLSSHRGGQNWVMRRRSQLEMDQLVESAGFRKVQQWIDADGIFTVSLAVRQGD
ncbi:MULTISPECIES: bifunctional alpha/beta hydrolase/class I SAM-dependent methyltransferase [Brachymonas]|uniref:bifunctional alpha/beta hydrolase/class I SAM-dependent methyltransferase n=1 Tax=Brachymonas TaxID=28219 RepID=UPI002E792E57|nr:bifunctional alpha/beta hydrolase/class I SAM-dependent methyltransferase [Brachymonas sp. J145]MEE1652450.1 bifunctional alpha/beta hydrolase/class I SAM-dependent methyltransferase [Brachymonas sp. J145]